jgi:uncharacterized protein YcbX
MGVFGKVESLWRYPVKSMAGEEREELFVGYAGVYGDRLFAIGNAAAPARFPYLTAREEASMLAYKPHFRHPAKASMSRRRRAIVWRSTMRRCSAPWGGAGMVSRSGCCARSGP